jgi:hypothetical protein
MFSHLYEGARFEGLGESAIPDDSLLPMRRIAHDMAREHAGSWHLVRAAANPEGEDAGFVRADLASRGSPTDREGTLHTGLGNGSARQRIWPPGPRK